MYPICYAIKNVACHNDHNDKMQNKPATTDTLSYSIQKLYY